MIMTPELEKAITGLYTAFQDRQLKTLMTGCPCCANDVELRRLSFTPLLDLERADLESYSWDAIWTVGDESDYRHFTPRLLELMVREDAFQSEVVAKKLVTAAWRTWPPAEQTAIETFFDAYWAAILTTDASWCVAEDAICVLGNVFDDLKPFLDRWITATEPTALKQLILFAGQESGNAWQGFISQAFWSDRPLQMKQVASWLCSPETLAKLEDRWLANPDSPLANQLKEAVDLITPAVKAASVEAEKNKV
jgi:hypothetical protein